MDDIARQLPDPPPARPAARAATMAAALAKFDGAEAPAKAAAARPARWQIGRGPGAVLASVVVVALIGIPVALLNPNDRFTGPPQRETRDVPPPATRDRPPAPAMRASPEAAAAVAPAERPAPLRIQPPPVAADSANAVAEVSPPPPAPVMAAPQPPPPLEPAPPPPIGSAAVPQAKAAPAALAARNASADSAREDIVVTGSRVSRNSTRGDWNACTVEDPARSLRGCGAATRARKSEAAETLSDGLAKAWQGDWDAAIAAFDAAIAREPKLGAAYLNRGLAYWHSGDLARATADLDLAVRYAPSARSYYNRARVRRATGNRRGAQADEARALEFDPGYATVIEN